MNTYWHNKLLNTLMVQTNSENEKLMVLYLDRELKKLKLPYYIDAAGNIIVTKGKAKTYPCVISHMDTVHSFVSDFKIYRDIDNEDVYFAMSNKQRVGIGGDDKCGVFACLYLLKVIPEIKIVFFSREEYGCKGSRYINKTFFADCRFIIQLDRRGKGDFIQTYWSKKTISHDFSSEIGLVKKKYKYKNKTGTVTDVMKLWDNKVGVSCVNLSCGYYMPHTDHEYISINDLWNSIKFTEEIINTLQPKRYTSLPPAPTVISRVATSTYPLPRGQCNTCFKWKPDTLLHDAGGGKKICWICKKHKKESGEKTDSPIQKHTTTTLFACNECGIKTSEMKAGDSLRYVNGLLYCSGCASLFSTSNKNDSPSVCEVCQEGIPQTHYRTTISGMLVCGVCACDLGDYTGAAGVPQKCWICDKIIPKDHKIIERFGKRICEDCACPSDTIKLEN